MNREFRSRRQAACCVLPGDPRVAKARKKEYGRFTMLQFDPGQLYFLGREASDRLQQLTRLGLEESEQAFALALKTVQFHLDAMTKLLVQTRHIQDFDGAAQLWAELFEVIRESASYATTAQKQAVDSALKCTEMFYATAFERSRALAKAAPLAD
jgi:hypothetical protein